MLESRTIIEVPFYDVDKYSIVWHGNYPRYLEVARCALLDRINYGYLEMEASGFVFPVVDLRLRYVKPIVFGQEILVSACLKEWQNWIKVNYEILDNKTGERLTKGMTKQVAVVLETMTMLEQSPVALLDRVRAAQDADESL